MVLSTFIILHQSIIQYNDDGIRCGLKSDFEDQFLKPMDDGQYRSLYDYSYHYFSAFYEEAFAELIRNPLPKDDEIIDGLLKAIKLRDHLMDYSYIINLCIATFYRFRIKKAMKMLYDPVVYNSSLDILKVLVKYNPELGGIGCEEKPRLINYAKHAAKFHKQLCAQYFKEEFIA